MSDGRLHRFIFDCYKIIQMGPWAYARYATWRAEQEYEEARYNMWAAGELNAEEDVHFEGDGTYRTAPKSNVEQLLDRAEPQGDFDGKPQRRQAFVYRATIIVAILVTISSVIQLVYLLR